MSLKTKFQYVYTIGSVIILTALVSGVVTFHKRNEYAD